MKIMSTVVWISLIVLVGAAVASFWFVYSPHPVGAIVAIGDGLASVKAEVAASPLARMRGLSGHAPLGPDEGMLFLFSSSQKYSFWMKDMKFPIDIIWIDGTRIVDITEDVPAPSGQGALPTFRPKQAANAVLEVNAGYARQHGLAAGLTVSVVGIDGKPVVR
jgi:hypothetical protein